MYQRAIAALVRNGARMSRHGGGSCWEQRLVGEALLRVGCTLLRVELLRRRLMR